MEWQRDTLTEGGIIKSVNESCAKLKREEKRNKKEKDAVGYCICLQKSPQVSFSRDRAFTLML